MHGLPSCKCQPHTALVVPNTGLVTLAIGLRAGRLTAGLQILRRKPRPGHSAAYCARLDTLPFRAETLDLGAESQFAFRLNAAVFEQLGTAFPSDLEAAT